MEIKVWAEAGMYEQYRYFYYTGAPPYGTHERSGETAYGEVARAEATASASCSWNERWNRCKLQLGHPGKAEENPGWRFLWFSREYGAAASVMVTHSSADGTSATFAIGFSAAWQAEVHVAGTASYNGAELGFIYSNMTGIKIENSTSFDVECKCVDD